MSDLEIQIEQLKHSINQALRTRAIELRLSSNLHGHEDRLSHIDVHIASLEEQLKELEDKNA